ncbi:MAG: hypothetical protein ABS49_13485 [Erythrobacter sp. SCN 62-14]|nr:MAG: hypothetical protein ABS49_13485 [Erythrobacter sp. SCN 62-14]
MSLIATLLLASLASAPDTPAAEVDAPAAARAPAAPPPEAPTARSVMQVQLDKAPPPQSERRQQSDAERERLMKIYLDAMGKPPERRSPGPNM